MKKQYHIGVLLCHDGSFHIHYIFADAKPEDYKAGYQVLRDAIMADYGDISAVTMGCGLAVDVRNPKPEHKALADVSTDMSLLRQGLIYTEGHCAAVPIPPEKLGPMAAEVFLLMHHMGVGSTRMFRDGGTYSHQPQLNLFRVRHVHDAGVTFIPLFTAFSNALPSF